MMAGLPFSLAAFQRGALGLLLDRERGLFAYAPIALVVPASWLLAGRPFAAWLVPVVLLYAPMASFTVWSAGFSPAARYLVPLVPLLAAPVAPALTFGRIRRAAAVLLAFQACVTAVVWMFPRTLWPQEMGSNAALERIPLVGPAYARLLPSLLTGDPVLHAWAVAAVIAAGTAALAWPRSGENRG
jgi:hypothetical protein